MKTMTSLQRCAYFGILIGLAAANGAYAQINTINSANIHPREFNDIPGSTLTVLNNYASLISFDDQKVSAPSGFANRHVWRFSNDSGVSAYKFNNNDFFSVFMTVTLTGSPVSPRKEAGFLLRSIGGDGQFIVNTDGHEVVAFGGPFPFYAFPATFDSGETITLGIHYFLDSNTGKRSIIYSANGVQSPVLPITNLEQGIIDNSTLGGYLQVVNASSVPSNFGTATFQNIKIGPTDLDVDGVPDSLDKCPNTPAGTLVNADGCSIEQLVPCNGPASGGTWKNHGAYVSSVAHAADQFLAQGVISESQKDAIVSTAAQSHCGSK